LTKKERDGKDPVTSMRIGHGKRDGEFQYSGIDELLKVERNLIFYNKSLMNKVLNFSKKNYSVLDFGAGIGTFSNLFYKTTGNKPDCLEIDHELSEHVRSRGFKCFNNLADINKKYDMIFTFNVLEHVPNDGEAIIKINDYLKPGGILIIYVPAFQLLYSNFDKHLGHYRRYSRKDLKEKITKANFQIIECYYNDFLGFFVGIIFKLVNYKKHRAIKESTYKFYDSIVYPISSVFDVLGLKRIAGKNLFLFAKKLK